MSDLKLYVNKNINIGIEKYLNNKDIILIDVRNIEEYKQGHIKGAINIPVNEIDKINEMVKDKNTTIFTYCNGGSRSTAIANKLVKMGYKNAEGIGGLLTYAGRLVI